SAQATLDEVQAAGGNMVSLHPCDLTQAPDCEALVKLALETHGRIDVLYNNAAMAYFEFMDDMQDATWYDTIDQELNLVYRLTRIAWPHLKQSGASIINIASVCGMIGFEVHPAAAHSAAKGAIIGLTHQLAVEGRHHGVRVNTISPGLIETNQSGPLLEDPAWAGPMLAKIMLNRLGKPEEVANAALFLASDESSYVTGANIVVDGGMTAW
ncbi:unnamed protein product, partial [Phaeothamnion confervicola]